MAQDTIEPTQPEPRTAPILPGDLLESVLLEQFYSAYAALEVLYTALEAGFPDEDGHGISEAEAIRGAEHLIGNAFEKMAWHLDAYNPKALRRAHRSVIRVLEDWRDNYVEPDIIDPQNSQKTTEWMGITMLTFEGIHLALFEKRNLQRTVKSTLTKMRKKNV